jgi:hypothetical protein
MDDIALSDFARSRYMASFAAVKFHPTDPNTLFLGHHGHPWMGLGLFKSTDAGQSWTTLNDQGLQTRSIATIDIDDSGQNIIVGREEMFYYHGAQ